MSKDYAIITPRSYNFSLKNYGEKNGMPSKTKPGQTRSIRQMVADFNNGKAIFGDRSEPYFSGEDSFSLGRDIRTLDLTELAAYRDEVRDYIKKVSDTYAVKANLAREIARKQEEERLEAWYNKKLSEQQPEKPKN